MVFFPLFRNIACVPNFGQADFQISTATQLINPKWLCYYRDSWVSQTKDILNVFIPITLTS